MIKKILFFDTETTGLPKNWKAPITDLDNWPRVIQIGAILSNSGGKELARQNDIIKPIGFTIPLEASKIHGTTQEIADSTGIPLEIALTNFNQLLSQADVVVAHNVSFDRTVLGAEFLRANMESHRGKVFYCTKEKTTNLCKIKNTSNWDGYKWPTLVELHYHLFKEHYEQKHDALDDVILLKKCFLKLIDMDFVKLNN